MGRCLWSVCVVDVWLLLVAVGIVYCLCVDIVACLLLFLFCVAVACVFVPCLLLYICAG